MLLRQFVYLTETSPANRDSIAYACLAGIAAAAQVRIRGVAVGSVLNVRPSLDKVEVHVEVREQLRM